MIELLRECGALLSLVNLCGQLTPAIRFKAAMLADRIEAALPGPDDSDVEVRDWRAVGEGEE